MLGKQTNKAQQLRKKGGCQRQPQTCWAAHMCPPTRITMGQQDSAGHGDIEPTLSCFSGMKKTSPQPQKRRQFFLFLLSPASSQFRFLFFVSWLQSQKQQLQTKKDNGHTNNIKPAKSAKAKGLNSTRLDCRCGLRAAAPRGQFQSLSNRGIAFIDRQKDITSSRRRSRSRSIGSLVASRPQKVKALHAAMTMTMRSSWSPHLPPPVLALATVCVTQNWHQARICLDYGQQWALALPIFK